MSQEIVNTTSNNITLNRMEPTNDVETNRRLFGLYESLIKPLKSVENKMDAAEKLRYHGHLIRAQKQHSVLIFIGILIAFICVIPIGAYSYAMHWAKVVDEKMGTEVPLEEQIAELKELSEFSYNLGNSPLSFADDLLITSVICALSVTLIIVIISKRKKGKKLAQMENDYNNLMAEINSDINYLKPYLQYVPPAYRTSHALGYFVDSYINVRIGNLMEAVRSYDNYVRNQNIQRQLRQIDGRLREIAYLQNRPVSNMHVGINLGVMSLWL